jgi:hypothetical protein
MFPNPREKVTAKNPSFFRNFYADFKEIKMQEILLKTPCKYH